MGWIARRSVWLDCPYFADVFEGRESSARTSLGQPVLDLMFVADPVEDVVEGIFVVRHVGEVDAPFDCLAAAVA